MHAISKTSAIRTLFENIWTEDKLYTILPWIFTTHACAWNIIKRDPTNLFRPVKLDRETISLWILSTPRQLFAAYARLMKPIIRSRYCLVWRNNTGSRILHRERIERRRVIWGFCEQGKLRDRSQVVNGETGQAMNNQCDTNLERIIFEVILRTFKDERSLANQ